MASAVIMSEILFFVNITMFDPREAFQVINMGFYIVTWQLDIPPDSLLIARKKACF